MSTKLDEKFKMAVDLVDGLRAYLLKISNGDEFKKQPQESQDGINEAINYLITFRSKHQAWDYTDEQKESIIESITGLTTSLFGGQNE